MENTYTQTILFDLPLPTFLVDFKNSINSFIVPSLNNIISDIQKQGSNSSILVLLCILIISIIGKSFVDNIFKNGKSTVGSNKPITQPLVDEEIRALSNQIKNLKNSLKRIIQQSSKQQGNLDLGSASNKTVGNLNPEDVGKLIQYYKQTADYFNNLAQFILNSQQSIFKELKNVKKYRASAEKTSSHGSRQQNVVQSQRYKQIQQKTLDTDFIQTPVQQPQPIPIQTKPPVIPKVVKAPVPVPGAKKRIPPPPMAK